MLKIPENFSVEDRAERARNLFKSGYNCAQSVSLAFEDVIEANYPIDRETIISLTSGFGGGFGRLREVCGTVSGMTFLAGVISPFNDPSDYSCKKENYTLVQKFAERFREENGSIVCRELLGLRKAQKDSPVSTERTADFYKVRPCESLVVCAARIVAEHIASL